jgi:zinc D-Ala-D-Ala carboxypeptidase
MNYKILIVKNNFHKRLDFSRGIDHLEDNTPLKIFTEELETSFNFTFQPVGNHKFSGGIPLLPVADLKKIIPEGKYNAVVIVSDKDDLNGLLRVSACYDTPLYPDTDVIYLSATSDRGQTFNHELFHAFFKKVNRRGVSLFDPMDLTFVNGVPTPYYNDTCLGCKESNRTIAIDALAPHWEKVTSFGGNGILDMLKQKLALLQQLLAVKQAETQPRWKYFKPEEKTGSFGTIADLKPELVDLLDKARETAQVPFRITSGYRTPAHNKKVGGASDSSHLTREAVDIACTDSAMRDKIIRALITIGFNRIGIAGTFIHCDIDKTKPQNVIWTY